MRCPYCDAIETKVIDSRNVRDSHSIRRRRECLECTKRFTTYENIEFSMPYIIKNDGRREEYSHSKLRRGIEKACGKRPVSREQIDDLLQSVEKTIFELGIKEIKTHEVGEYVIKKLRFLDPVAYVRFASVYKQFKDIDEFVDEIKVEEQS